MNESEVLKKLLAHAVAKRDELKAERDAKVERISRQYEVRLSDQEIYIRKLQEDIQGIQPKGRLEEAPEQPKKVEATPKRGAQAELLPTVGTKRLIKTDELPKVSEEALRHLGKPAKANNILKQIDAMGISVDIANPFAALKRAMIKHTDKFLSVGDKEWALREWNFPGQPGKTKEEG